MRSFGQSVPRRPEPVRIHSRTCQVPVSTLERLFASDKATLSTKHLGLSGSDRHEALQAPLPCRGCCLSCSASARDNYSFVNNRAVHCAHRLYQHEWSPCTSDSYARSISSLHPRSYMFRDTKWQLPLSGYRLQFDHRWHQWRNIDLK